MGESDLFRRCFLLRGKFRLGLGQDLPLGLGGQLALVKPGEQVRPPGHGALVALLLPPGSHLAVVPGEQDLRHCPVVPHGGAGVLGVLQQAVPVGLLLEALLVRQDAGHHAAHGVAHCHGGDLPAGEDEVAHGDLLVHALVQKPLVHALVVAAHQDQVVVALFQLPGHRLGEGPAAGGHENGPAGTVGGDHVVPAAVQGVRLHDGAPAAAVGVVVHLHLLVGGIRTDLVGLDGDVAPLLGPAQDADVQHGVHGVGEEGQDINSHRTPSPPTHGPPCGFAPGPPTG